jgi:hypothetical protein
MEVISRVEPLADGFASDERQVSKELMNLIYLQRFVLLPTCKLSTCGRKKLHGQQNMRSEFA